MKSFITYVWVIIQNRLTGLSKNRQNTSANTVCMCCAVLCALFVTFPQTDCCLRKSLCVWAQHWGTDALHITFDSQLKCFSSPKLCQKIHDSVLEKN